jgi:hypothetical protein
VEPRRGRASPSPARTHTVAGARALSVTSVLDHALEQEPAKRPVESVESQQEHQPGAQLTHRVAEDEERGGLHRREQGGDDERKEKEGQQRLLRS